VHLIRHALAQLGVDEALVLGHSLAGAAAAHFAIAHRDFTRGLVLVAPVTHPWPGGITWYYRLAARPFLGALFSHVFAMPVGLALMRRAVAGIFAPQSPPDDYIERIGAGLVLRPRQFMANAQDIAGLAAFIAVQVKHMSEIAAPTTIVTGTDDGVVYAHLHSLGSARDIVDAQLMILPGIGHAVQNVVPEKIVEALLDVARRAGL
jgi:pimeloyl-ACP methyl ester carboxylesterase